jgi:hypothetical protein
MIGAIARILIPVNSRAVYWSTVALVLLIPTAWLPTFLGFPDVGGATLVAMALFVHLRFSKLERIWPSVLIGFLLGAAILFRHHYVYAGTAFILSMVVQSLVGILIGSARENRGALCYLSQSLLRPSVTAAAAALSFALLGFPYLLQPDLEFAFSAIYPRAAQPVLHNLAYYGFIFGWLLCLLSIMGFISGASLRVVALGKALFVVLFGIITFAHWVLLVGQTNPQFTLHFTVFVVLGLASLIWTVHQKTTGRVRLLALGVGVAGLATSMVLSLMPIASARQTSRPAARSSWPGMRQLPGGTTASSCGW